MALRHSSLRRAVSAVAVTVCLALFAAGCSDEGESDPESEPTQTSQAPTTPSSSPSASEMPEPETAKAFIRRWMKVSDAMQNTGNTKAYLKLATRRCESCKTVADSVDEIYGAGGTVKVPPSRIRRLTRIGGPEAAPRFELVIQVAESTVVDSPGAEPRTLTGGEGTLIITLKESGESWKVDSSVLRTQ